MPNASADDMEAVEFTGWSDLRAGTGKLWI